MTGLRLPIATYRLQLNYAFRFEDARSLVPYLSQLGISDLYASPILKARSKSSHGYDIVDPSSLNPELGGQEDFEALVRELKEYGMGLLLDIVPNHMAAHPDNPWWNDLLENGLTSPYASFFDIEWQPVYHHTQYRVLLPILAGPYRQVLENRELVLTLEEIGLALHYHDIELPLDIKAYSSVISHRFASLHESLGPHDPAYRQLKQLLDALVRLPDHWNYGSKQGQAIYHERQLLKEEFRRLIRLSPKIKTFISENVAHFNGRKNKPHSFNQLDRLLGQQVYELAFWKTALREINYRRFFDINDLIAVRVEEPQVFDSRHTLILQMIEDGKISGLRVDHIDGLYNPFDYLYRLHDNITGRQKETSSGKDFYMVVEKILSSDENLPQEWPVSGTTGYDFLNELPCVFVDSRGLRFIRDMYRKLTGSEEKFVDIVYNKKRQVIDELFPGELKALVSQLAELAVPDQEYRDITQEDMTEAIASVTSSLDVYRTYIRDPHVNTVDRIYIERALHSARQSKPDVDVRAFAFLERVLLLDFPDTIDQEQKIAWLLFIMRWQQFTAPVMAKGFEDTALYTYNPLISLNEVGGDPGATTFSVETFHRQNTARQERWPFTMNTTSTHDTKRSEDVRSRIHVISEDPEGWDRHLSQWIKWNQSKKPAVDGQSVPEPELEVLIYETLIGAWPLAADEIPDFKERFKAYVIKAAREAKTSTSWISLNAEYESALITFVESILDDHEQNDFLKDFLLFQEPIAYYGALNSLGQVILKTASPGVPDFYQGSELWDFSMADPDNRRPVDFEKRRRYLDEIVRREAAEQSQLVSELLSSWKDGRLKLYVTYRSLNLRAAHRDLFSLGAYMQLESTGKGKEQVCAFARCHGVNWALIIVPRLLTRIVNAASPPLGKEVWGKDVLLLPEDAPDRWLHVFTGDVAEVLPKTKELYLSEIFSRFPVALLVHV